MKSTKSLLAALVLVASVFTGCVKEDVVTGIDKNKPAPKEFKYDAVGSSATAIAVYWNAGEAVANGATSFTVQIPTGLNNGDNYSKTTSQTLQTTAAVYDAATFSGLAEYDRYYVRVRANYPNSVYSDWVYLTLDGEPAPFEVGYGLVDAEIAGVDDLAYNGTESTKTSMVFDFDAAAAEAKDAVAVRFQLINFTTDAISYTQALDFPLAASKVNFADLKEGDQYQVRARAEYEGEEGSVLCSEWAYASGITEEGTESEVYEVGKGAIVPKDVPPTVDLLYASSSTLTLKWSECGFTSIAKDIKRPYNVQLYRDQECKDLVVSWLLDANTSLYDGDQPSFLFSGLEQNTAYYCVVTDEVSGLASEPFKATTEAFEVVTVGETPVEAGAYALAEDFSELVWGGDMLHGGVAYSSEGRSSAPTLDKAEGVNPVGKGTGYYLIANSTEMGLFNTLDDAVPTTRLATWGTINEGTANSYVCARSGHLKIGASSYTADLCTPVLSNLKETATVELSFDAAQYGSDDLTMSVKVIYGATEAGKNVLTDASLQVAEDFELKGTKDWEHFTFEIANVPPTARLAVTARRVGTTAGTDQHRFYLDNVKVKVVSYGSVAIQLAAPVISEATADAETINVTWGAVDKALSYTVEYKETAAAEWTAVENLTETTYAITGLKDGTSYDVRVKAVAGDSASEYSEVKVVETLKKAAFPKTVNTADELVALFEGEDLKTAGATDEVILGADIDMTGKTLKPAEAFAGILDGKGKSIKNWTTSTPIFETLAGTVKDLVIDASCVITPGYTFGIIANTNEGTISKVTNNAAISFTVADAEKKSILIAPIAAISTGSITECTNNANVTVKSEAGLYAAGAAGIAAYQAGAIANCVNNGAITMESLYTTEKVTTVGTIGKAVPGIGGLVAYAGEGFTMNNCENNGKLSFKQTQINKTPSREIVLDAEDKTAHALNRHLIGGLVGAGNGNINNSNNKGDIEVIAVTSDRSDYSTADSGLTQEYNFCVGGITGGDYYAKGQCATSIIGCSNSGKIVVDCDASKSNSTFGGIVGWPNKESGATNVTENCTNSGDLKLSGAGKFRMGGIQGGSGIIKGSKNTGNVTVLSANTGSVAGLIAGFHSGGFALENCIAQGTLKVDCKINGAGALMGNIGNAAHTTGNNCQVDATIDATAVENVGMIIGVFNGKTKNITLGTEAEPIKINGTVNGTALTAENYTQYLNGANNYTAGVHVFNTVFGK